MKNTLIIIIILVFSSISGISQRSTYFGGEFAVNEDIYDIIDPNNLITTTPLVTGLWGFTIGQEINKNFLVETGLIRKYYSEGYGYNVGSINMAVESDAYNTWQIPLRLKSRINLVKEKLFLTATIGYHISINSEYGYGGGSGGSTYVNGNDTIKIQYTENDSLAKTFSLIEAGLGIEFEIFNGFILSLSSSYYAGLKKVYQLDMTTESNYHPSNNAYWISKGGYWNVALGIKYAISNFWRKQ